MAQSKFAVIAISMQKCRSSRLFLLP